ncbi:Phospho-2-dehydro-3-deoxyheptonate aldolase (3-deoxy-D-arabino-heptulosonate 7-phosphate synthase) (DAHP synthase) (Phospho-2-keto-3-deoxyheptonate aldolase) [Durusdinium trenchii]|uniref:Phospho-2-dehydro-3-deoxyheptonate aldolase n=1 Tax=Durusdinium trenchii TaxID=1381693 RepID=A0ABP0IQP0_9DINO
MAWAGYWHSAATLNFLRGYISDLKGSEHAASYTADAQAIAQKPLSSEQLEFFTSHEAMQLDLEEALTRAVGSKYYNLSAHLVWIGDRTRQLDCAHIEYFRGISNPIGVKVGPSMKNDELKDLVTVLNPKKEEGRLMLITRYGAGKAEAMLPGHIQAVKESGVPVTWQCDGVHGNGVVASNKLKTRCFDDIMTEILEVKVDPTSLAIGLGLGALAGFLLSKALSKSTLVNPGIDKASEKVATVQTLKQVEETMKSNDGKAVFCRCWRSSKFPYCDGSHGKYNKECCDNTGPLVLKTA